MLALSIALLATLMSSARAEEGEECRQARAALKAAEKTRATALAEWRKAGNRFDNASNEIDATWDKLKKVAVKCMEADVDVDQARDDLQACDSAPADLAPLTDCSKAAVRLARAEKTYAALKAQKAALESEHTRDEVALGAAEDALEAAYRAYKAAEAAVEHARLAVARACGQQNR